MAVSMWLLRGEAVVARQMNKLLDFLQGDVILLSCGKFCTQFAHRLHTKNGKIFKNRQSKTRSQSNKGSVENRDVPAVNPENEQVL